MRLEFNEDSQILKFLEFTYIFFRFPEGFRKTAFTLEPLETNPGTMLE